MSQDELRESLEIVMRHLQAEEIDLKFVAKLAEHCGLRILISLVQGADDEDKRRGADGGLSSKAAAGKRGADDADSGD